MLVLNVPGLAWGCINIKSTQGDVIGQLQINQTVPATRTAKKLLGLIATTTTTKHTHFFVVHFFAVVLHDYNVNFLVTRSTEEISHVFPLALFSLPLIFTTCVCLSIHLQMDGISYRVLSLFLCFSKGQEVNVTINVGLHVLDGCTGGHVIIKFSRFLRLKD